MTKQEIDDKKQNLKVLKKELYKTSLYKQIRNLEWEIHELEESFKQRFCKHPKLEGVYGESTEANFRKFLWINACCPDCLTVNNHYCYDNKDEEYLRIETMCSKLEESNTNMEKSNLELIKKLKSKFEKVEITI